jgi:hypothetical protein
LEQSRATRRDHGISATYHTLFLPYLIGGINLSKSRKYKNILKNNKVDLVINDGRSILLKIIFEDVIQMTEKIVLGVKNYVIMMRHYIQGY